MNDYFEFEGVTDELFLNKKENYNFEGNSSSGGSTDWGKVITSGLDTASKFIPQSGSRLNEDAKQGVASKKEAQALRKRINSECRIKPLVGKQKKAKWEECKNKVVEKFESKFSQSITDNQKKQELLLQLSQQEKQQQQSNKKLYVIVGVISLTLVLGTIIYLKKKG